jgi:CPA2 family monovalent cation:H+ antiporter-2
MLSPVLASSGLSGTNPVVDLVVILVAAAAAGLLMGRLRLAAIPGYLLIGAAIGPHAMGLVSSGENIALIAELALILLMFTIGLHMDTGTIRTGMAPILLVGAVSTSAVALVAWPIAMAFGTGAPAGFVVGVIVAMSSTGVLLGILQTRREVHRVHGRLCIGISIVQDLMSIGILAAMPTIAAWAGTGGTPAGEGAPTTIRLLSSAALATGVVASMILVGRWLLPRVLREASRSGAAGGGGVEELILVAAAIAMAAAVLTALVGIGPALGAFLAGFLLAGTPFRYQISGQMAPLRDLFMAVFFTTVGLRMDIPAVADLWWVVLLGLVLVVTVKFVIIGATAWVFGASGVVAGVSALLLANAGEFSLVILQLAASKGIVDQRTQGVVIALVVGSLIVTALAYDPAQRWRGRLAKLRAAPWVARSALREAAPAHGVGDGQPLVESSGKLIIAGFGVVGRALADRFEVAGLPFTIVELNAATVRKQRALGREAIYGDIANPDVLESAGIHQAEAVLLTVPDDEAVIAACQAIRSLAPHVFIGARASYLSTGFRAGAAGADHVSVSEIAIAEAMAKQVSRLLEERARASGRTLHLLDATGATGDATPPPPEEPLMPPKTGAAPAPAEPRDLGAG